MERDLDFGFEVVDKRKSPQYSSAYHPQYDGEGGFEETITEQSYVPLKDQVEEMIHHGALVEGYRYELYHFGPDEEVPETFEDINMLEGLDPADVWFERGRLLGRQAKEKATREVIASRKALREKRRLEKDTGGVEKDVTNAVLGDAEKRVASAPPGKLRKRAKPADSGHDVALDDNMAR